MTASAFVPLCLKACESYDRRLISPLYTNTLRMTKIIRQRFFTHKVIFVATTKLDTLIHTTFSFLFLSLFQAASRSIARWEITGVWNAIITFTFDYAIFQDKFVAIFKVPFYIFYNRIGLLFLLTVKPLYFDLLNLMEFPRLAQLFISVKN